MADAHQQCRSSAFAAPVSRRRFLSLSAAAGMGVVGASALSACAPSAGSGLADSPNTIRAAIAGEPDQLDPHKTSSYFSFEILENVFDTLVEPNEQLQMVPALAQRWEVSPDATRWTFTLRPGVQFHNGDPLTANDVVYSYRRIIDQQLSSSWRLENVATVEAPDAQTVVLTTKSPSPNLLANIGGFKGMAIVNRRNVESGEITTRPIGTGPFAYQSGSPGTSLVLKARPGHFSGGPHVDGVAFSFISQGTTAVSAVRSGEVDWTDSIPAQQIGILRNDDALTVGTVVANDYWYVTMNFAKAPFGDTRIRQAVAYAIDRPSIAQVVGYGTATPNQLAIPKTSPWFTEYDRYTAGLTRDAALDKARGLLRAAGHRSLPMGLMVTTEYPETVTAAQVVASNLADVGIDVTIEQLDFGVWLDRQSQGKFDALLLGWLGNIDPDDYYYAQHHTGGTSNSQKYSNPAVDRLLDAGRTELDVTRRKSIYADAATRIADDVSYLYLYNPSATQAYTTALLDYTVRSDKAIRFRDARLDRSRGQ
ncbi:putative peptide-binding periplasmic protein [Gordonia polyisoprenivorans VH2]|uniref:Putative peptide-binding periplasmic protein n=1 Tax=Gordonia polyisoprenivorans (strain DSM 44266 / VH2) TaxID=1112204 RepID=H6N4H3_GORPV|nr:ABC transporter substrate-binding protein [Gordonia polyisoprenivorans]AFA72442.1 putative peptide-binding periplasmic protein [Gordonia polyisoprenivorans VH2]